MAPMSIRLVAAAKGLAVGVLTLCFSVIGAYAYAMWRSSACTGFAPDPECNAVTSFGIVVVLFALMLVLGPLVAWGFLLPLPGGYVIPVFLTAFVDSLMLYAGLPREFLLVAPFAAFPVVAALTADRRRKAPAPAPSPGSPASP
jgi:hypothetical protein